MNTAVKLSPTVPAPQGVAPTTSAGLPNIEIWFSPLYAWLLMGFGGVFFVLGMYVASPLVKVRMVGLGIFICLMSIAAIVGGNYWRHHLPVVVRMTPRQLLLPRCGVVNWTDIVEIEKKTVAVSRHGVRSSSEWVCFKLKNPPVAKSRLGQAYPAWDRLNQALVKTMKNAILGGYDVVINPQDELLRDADWFMAECKKRMAAATSAKSS